LEDEPIKYKNLINQMTLEEKASLMSGKDFWTTKPIDRLNIPSIFLADGPHGIRKQAISPDHVGLNESIPATCYPTAATIANSWNIKLAEKIGEYLGIEAKSQGVNVLLGPGTNIKRNPLCGRNFEYFSEDPLLAGKFSAAYIRGTQSQGVSACQKHFAANNQEYRRMVINSIIDERALREIYLKAFEIGIKEGGLKCLMSSYNKLNGYYTNENPHLMQDILRKDWKYEGVVVTDWGGNNDRIKGLMAGNSLEMPSTSGETDQEIIEAVKSGYLDESILDENVDRLLTLIFDTYNEKSDSMEKFNIETHHKLAEEAALESIVLLKNNNKILPLDEKKKIAIIGDFAVKPRFQGAGSSIVNPTKLDNVKDSIKDSNLNFIGYEPGFERYGKQSKALKKKARLLAEKSDVILLFIGLDEFSEVEGMDRTNMSLPQNQLDLLENLCQTNKPIVVVLAAGSAIEMPWADKVEAILHTSLSGQSGAKATLKILSGIVNPSGKLSESIANSYSDYPSSQYFPGKEETVEYRESIFVGYRYFDYKPSLVKIPFGYGLSYTDFKYNDLDIEGKTIKFKITNTGDSDGSEISQIYISANKSKVFRPLKELKGFSKTFIKAGETVAVEITLDDYAFDFYHVKNNKWMAEELDYNIMIGSSSQDIRLKKVIHISGETIDTDFNSQNLPSYYSGNITRINDSEFELLLGRKIPDPKTIFYKKSRLMVNYNTTVAYLRYAKGFSGKLLIGIINGLIRYYNFTRQREKANFLIMGVLHLPLRGLARMSAGKISHGQLDGLIMMFNGLFFAGLKKYFSERKLKKAKQNKLLN